MGLFRNTLLYTLLPQSIRWMISLKDQLLMGFLKELAFSNEVMPGKEYEFEINVARKTFTIEMKYTASNRDEGILVFQDVSAKKNLERLKSDFINNATHEMRTPLTTILLMIDLMEKTVDASRRRILGYFKR